MDISAVYERQRAHALASFRDIVSEAHLLRLDSGIPLKLRLELVDGSIVDIFHSITGEYSYHWERALIDGSIYRHDNGPHQRWRDIKTFPKHFHNGAEDMCQASDLSDDPRLALEEFLMFVRHKLAQTSPPLLTYTIQSLEGLNAYTLTVGD